MISDDNDVGSSSGVEGAGSKGLKSKPAKVLPTDRVSFDKQLALLRGYAAASGAEKRAVSNSEVGSVVGVHPGSVSNCNPFFFDVGLIVRESGVYKPSEAVFDYANSYAWSADEAGLKLASTLSGTWFYAALLPRLNFRPLAKDEALKVLADEAKAAPEYRDQLCLLLDYLAVAGLVSLEGNSVTPRTPASRMPPPDVVSSKPPVAPPTIGELPILHPFIEGLLKTLPNPESDWPVAKRVKWLQAASNIFDLIYSSTSETTAIRIIADVEGGNT